MKMGETISEKCFLASEPSASGITRNNYVASLSFDEKAKIYDVQVRLDEVNSGINQIHIESAAVGFKGIRIQFGFGSV